MDNPEKTDKERTIEEDSIRWMFPDATIIWVLSGDIEPKEIDKARPLINRDLLKLGIYSQKHQNDCVFLVKAGDPVEQWCKNAARFVQGTQCYVLGKDFSVPNPYLVCLKSSNFAIMYGQQPSWWDDLVPSSEYQVVNRDLEKVGSEVQPLFRDADPYSQYKAIVELVREWSIEPYKGLQTRDMIDIRPHRTIN